MRTVREGKPITPFFASWEQIQGRIETGYFLGHEAILALERNLDLRQIALLDHVDEHLKPILESLAKRYDSHNP